MLKTTWTESVHSISVGKMNVDNILKCEKSRFVKVESNKSVEAVEWE
jgi:hypothetical protein